MTRITLTSTVGLDGMLHLNVPVGNEEAGKVVKVTIESNLERPRKAVTQQEWEATLLATAGSIPDATFIRHEQGEYEQRDEL